MTNDRSSDSDANVPEIWLFNRNDAIANVAVICAAALVAWTQRAWTELIVAVIIALLFLHSAYIIAREVAAELRAIHEKPKTELIE